MEDQQNGELIIQTRGALSRGKGGSDPKSFQYNPSNPESCYLEAFQWLAENAQQHGVRDVQSILSQVESRSSRVG